MRRVALAAFALLLVLPPAQALVIDDASDVPAFADRVVGMVREASPVPLPTLEDPGDFGLQCLMTAGDTGLGLAYQSHLCPSGGENFPSVFQDNETAGDDPTVGPAAAPPAKNETVAEEPPTPAQTAFEAALDSEPAAPQPTPFSPGPRTAQPAPQPAADLSPVPALSPGGGMSVRLLALGAAAAAAAFVPSLAFKLASLLALRRARREDSPLRSEILALLSAEPGLHHTELVRRIGRGNGTVEHHLQVLVREGRVQRLATPGHTCYFPAQADPAAARARAALRGRTSRALVAALAAAQGPRSLSQLAADLGVALSTAHYHAGRLAAAGVLADERLGARRGLALTPLGRSLAGAPPPAAAGAPDASAMGGGGASSTGSEPHTLS